MDFYFILFASESVFYPQQTRHHDRSTTWKSNDNRILSKTRNYSTFPMNNFNPNHIEVCNIVFHFIFTCL